MVTKTMCTARKLCNDGICRSMTAGRLAMPLHKPTVVDDISCILLADKKLAAFFLAYCLSSDDICLRAISIHFYPVHRGDAPIEGQVAYRISTRCKCRKQVIGVIDTSALWKRRAEYVFSSGGAICD